MNSKRIVSASIGSALALFGTLACGGDDTTQPPGGQGTPPAAPSEMTAMPLAGPAIHVTWKDNTDDEDSFVLERKEGGGQFAPLLPNPTFDSIVHHDATVMAG